MEFEAKISFKIADLPKELLDKHVMQLVMLSKGSKPITINGVDVYSDDEPPSLADINLARSTGESRTVKTLYIVKDKIYGAPPFWLRSIDETDIDIDIELDDNLGFYLLVKSSPHTHNTEIRFRGKDWPIVKPLFELMSKMEKAQKCDRCGQLLVYANGEFINDPRVTTCQCSCPERETQAEPASA